jgi:hypothetical protein
LESAAQDPNTFEKKVKATMKLLDWGWDWPTLLLLGTIFGVTINYYGTKLNNWYCFYIIGDFKESVLRVGLEAVFKVTDNKLIPNYSLEIMNDSIIDLMLYLNLF